MTARDDFVAYLFDHRVGVVQTVQLTLAKLDAALAEVAKEQMEADCQEICGRCFEGELVRLRQGDFGHWTHLDGRICEADSIRRAWVERNNGTEADNGGERIG